MAPHYRHIISRGCEHQWWLWPRPPLAALYRSQEDHDSCPGTLLAKLNTKSAYRLMLVHPTDHPFLAFEWKGKRLSMACCCLVWDRPRKYSWQWWTHLSGLFRWQYLDDFIMFGPASTPAWANTRKIIYRKKTVPSGCNCSISRQKGLSAWPIFQIPTHWRKSLKRIPQRRLLQWVIARKDIPVDVAVVVHLDTSSGIVQSSSQK